MNYSFASRSLRTLLFMGCALVGMCAASAAQTMTLAWNANTESNLGGYTVQYGTQAGSPSTSVDVGRVTSRAFSGLSAGTTYYFRVRAYNTSGQTSAPSTEVSYAVPGGTSTAPTWSSISPTSGPIAGGTQVTITGQNFRSGSQVWVGGRGASTTYVSTTQLRATTPAGTAAGSTHVSVTTPGFPTVTRNGAFTYTSTSSTAPTFSSISPTSGPLAGGTQVTVTGTNFRSSSRVWVGGRIASTTYVSSTQLRATTPAGTTAGLTHVSVTTPDYATVTRTGAFTYTSTSGGALSINGVTPNSGPLAGGTTITITGSGFVSGATVRVGSRAATSITFVSASQLRARTPAGTAASGFAVVVTNPGGQTATRNNAFWYTGSSSATAAETLASADAAETLMTAQAASVEADTLLSAQDVIAEASRSLTAPADVETSTEPRYLALDSGAAAARTRLALTNAGATPTTASLTFTDAAGKATRETIELPARQRRTLDARSTPALRAPVSVALEAGADVALERLSIADDQAASSLTAAIAPAVKWEFAAGSTRAPFDLTFTIENPGAAEAVVEARYLLPGDREPVTARYQAPAGGRTTIDVRRLHPSLADLDVSAAFTTAEATPILVTRTQSLATRKGGSLAGETSVGAAEPATTWRVAGETKGAALSLAIVNPNDEPALVEARYTTAEGGVVTRRYDVAAQRRLTVEVAAEDASLASTAVDIDVESVNGASIVVERTQWWGARTGWTDGLANIGPTAPAARWVLAEAEDGGADRALTTLHVANVSTQAVDARVTVLFEDAAEVSTVVSVGAGAAITTPVVKLAPAVDGRRYSILVEAVDGSASLLVDRRLFQTAPDGRVMGSASAAAAVR
jgi:hypothetical protein